jgi:hypothetical protein
MSFNEKVDNFKSGAKKFFIKVGVGLAVILVGVMLFLYYGVYEDGVRSGIVIRIGKKGTIFKTYEGQLNLQTFGAVDRPNVISEVFDFSVEKKRSDLINEIENVSLSGERVSLHYKKRYAIIPWRGNTKYFVYDVKRMGE